MDHRQLTRKGKELADRLVESVRERRSGQVAVPSADEKTQLKVLLRKLLEHLETADVEKESEDEARQEMKRPRSPRDLTMRSTKRTKQSGASAGALKDSRRLCLRTTASF